MSIRLCIRAPTPEDRTSFVAFERDNREPFEHFNEPNACHYYSDAGLAQAFDKLLGRQHPDRFLTRVVLQEGSERWVGKGSLTVHRSNSGDFARLVYQTDRHHWRQGTASVLLADLVGQANALGLPRVDALIAWDNTVSLHLLRRAGFKVAGWSSPAKLMRGQIDCLQLSRPLRSAVGAVMQRPHMHLPA